jgi:hypothetical protein
MKNNWKLLIVLILVQICAIFVWMGNDTSEKIRLQIRQDRTNKVCAEVLETVRRIEDNNGKWTDASIEYISIERCEDYDYYQVLVELHQPLVAPTGQAYDFLSFNVVVPNRPTMNCIIVDMVKRPKR